MRRAEEAQIFRSAFSAESEGLDMIILKVFGFFAAFAAGAGIGTAGLVALEYDSFRGDGNFSSRWRECASS